MNHDFLFLRATDREGRAYGGFQWPTGPDAVGQIVEAPDWNPEPKCGRGLHGLDGRGAEKADSGHNSSASNSGYSGAASNSGDRGAASSVGLHGVALEASGTGRAMVAESNLLVLVERDDDGKIIGHFAALCGTCGVEPGRWYRLRDGKLVDVTDGEE